MKITPGIQERQASLPIRSTLSDRLWMVMRRILRLLAPHVAMPGRCRYCWVSLELIRELITEYEGGYIARHDRHWECPRCEDRTTESVVFFRDLDIWSHS